MKKFLFTIVALLAVSAVFAQSPRTITEAQALYDNTVIDQRRAVEEAKSEERLTVDAAESRLNLVKSDLQGVKEHYRKVVEEQKARVAKAKAELKSATERYKQEAARTKQEVAAAKAKTKSIVEDHKSRVAQAKSEIARVKAEAQGAVGKDAPKNNRR